jgi:hypothetical protein
MIPRAHRRLTAWLGLFAIWLIVLAPTVSRMLETQRHLPALICSASGLANGHHNTSAADIHDDDPLQACDYCGLLAHNTVLLTAPPAQLTVTLLVQHTVVTPLDTRFVPVGAFPSGRPRGPPFFS